MEKPVSIKAINEEFKAADKADYLKLIEKYSGDPRESVKKTLMGYGRKYDEYVFETKRIKHMKQVENSLYNEGYQFVAGTDEVGRGPLCGPVVSVCIIMPKESEILYINDSKKLSAKKREELSEKILKEAISVGIGIVDNNTIDEINILNATKLSMKLAFEKLNPKPDILLIDALKLDIDTEQRSYIKGDANIYSIAAASIVAKVARDSLMDDYGLIYPGYGLDANKGYGSQEHIEAIRKLGPTPIHRRSFLNGILNDTPRAKGQENEQRALKYLLNKGMTLIEKNYARRGGEIDLIMSDNDTVVFCEVKAAAYIKGDTPATKVDEKKKERIYSTAYKYITENGLADKSIRYDVVAIELFDNGMYKIKHYINAFV